MARTPTRAAKRQPPARGRRLLRNAPGTAMPPAKGAPAAVYPIAVHPSSEAVAPQPLNDRYPIIVGDRINSQYLSSTFRLAITGYRQQYVDVLGEVLDMDAHLLSVLVKLIVSIANGRMEITPADLPSGHPDEELAKDAAKFVQMDIDRIPDKTTALVQLLWAIYYGLSALEIFWTRDGDGWHVDRFGFIHSRRLSYPDPQSWSLHIWDQGQVYGWRTTIGSSPTNAALFGLRIEDYPGKFIVYSPQIRGEYPTRDGLGRQASIWGLFKRVGARGALDYLETSAHPYMDVSWTTYNEGVLDDTQGGKPRAAEEEDIALAKQIAATIGSGAGSYAAHGDCVKIEQKTSEGTGGSKITWAEWIGICNAEQSKCVLGGTLGTDVGKGGGNRALGEVQERAEVDIEQMYATTLAEAFKRDVVTHLIRLNRPEALRVVPNVVLHVDTDPDPKSLVALAKEMTAIGAPVNLDKLAEAVGIELVPNEDVGDDGKPKPRRSFVSDVEDPGAVDPHLLSDEAKAQAEQDRQDKAAAAKALAEARAKGGAPDQPTNEPTPESPANEPPGKTSKKPAAKAGTTRTP